MLRPPYFEKMNAGESILLHSFSKYHTNEYSWIYAFPDLPHGAARPMILPCATPGGIIHADKLLLTYLTKMYLLYTIKLMLYIK
ncbi:MAG: hypothetical protein CVU51_16035 [Deltaproteobacteria bacterium HGW-Deltaproteobacteria-1]|nr:MAG: hypothetical protein CVU51_16035 [Deltaproteobacteria bacterium HGW-Deltaproteobacteria-1]